LFEQAAGRKILSHDLHRFRIRFHKRYHARAATQRFDADRPGAGIQIEKTTAGNAAPKN
jgi:hypothetical protein